MTAPAELAPPPLWTFHLPGKHGQKSHGHLGGLTGQDALDAVPAKLTPAPGAHTGDYTGAGDLSELWNLTAAAPRQVGGPSLQELDAAADAMAAVVATQLGRVAGFAARNLGGVTIASGLWDFEAPNQPRDNKGRWTEGGGGGGQTVDGLTRGRMPSVSTAAEGTNPSYGSTAEGPTYRDAARAGQPWDPEMGPPPSGAFEENCSNAVMAFEMRMRGYDVQAAPMDVLDKYGYAGGRTSRELDDLVTGSWRSPDGSSHGRTFGGQKWRNFKQIDKEIESWPEGGRGFMYVGKHVFSVVKINGRVQYVESQFDAKIVTREYRAKYGGKNGQGKLIRLDDLKPTNGIFQAIKIPG